jgi:hypothetical protein
LPQKANGYDIKNKFKARIPHSSSHLPQKAIGLRQNPTLQPTLSKILGSSKSISPHAAFHSIILIETKDKRPGQK